jgi:hypothetical protein
MGLSPVAQCGSILRGRRGPPPITSPGRAERHTTRPEKMWRHGVPEPMPHARAIVSGRGHVFTYADPAMLELVCRPILGIPVAEAFPEPEFRLIIALYDIAAELGRPISVATTSAGGTDGVLTLLPLGGHQIELRWTPAASRIPSARPAPRDPVPAGAR